MTNTTEYTGLVLLSGADATGIAAELFEALAPFSISILDVEELVVRGRLIFTLLISLNKDHTTAIETDLLTFAESKGLDLAIDFAAIPLLDSRPAAHGARLVVTANECKPASLAKIARTVSDCGGNILAMHRIPGLSELTIEIYLAASSENAIKQISDSLKIASINAKLENI